MNSLCDTGTMLLRNVLECPEDDDLRLLYADLLEENGQGDRAAFIKVQCELAKHHPVKCSQCGQLSTDAPKQKYCGSGGDKDYNHRYEPHGWTVEWLYALRNSERQLLDAHEGDWALQELGPFVAHSGNVFKFYRGFIERIELSTSDFLQHAAAIFSSQPVTHVVLTDAVIFPSGGNATYYLGGLGRFPSKYWRELEGLPSIPAVQDAVSRVCVSHGREAARLPL